MKKNCFVICDEEKSYSNRISSYLSTHGFFQYTIMTFSSIEKMCEYFYQDDDKIEILLISENVYQEDSILKKASKIIILQDRGILQVEDLPMIRKYQSIPNMMKQISELCAQDINCKGMLSSGSKETKIYGFYTPGEDDISCVCSSLFAQSMSEEKKVLYLNLSSYASMKELFTSENGQDGYDLGDLIYYLKQNEEKALYKIDAIKQSIGKLDYVDPIAYPCDLREITIEEWNKLIHCLCQRSDYEIVVVSCGEALQNVIGFLENCDYIITPINKSPLLQDRLKIFIKMCREKGLEQLLEKIQQIDVTGDAEEMSFSMKEKMYEQLGKQIKEMVIRHDIECTRGM